jgi:pimeloyl-ACP methyl ester carboxylesterase
VEFRSVDVAGASVRVRVGGAEGGVPFVFWHSLGHAGNGSFLDIAVPALAAAGCATYAIDGPGFGGSDVLEPDAYAIDHLAALLWDVVDALDLTRPIVLSGHSWGGTVAITAAARHPASVGALVLLDSGHLDYADVPGANPEATVVELIAELKEDPPPPTWDELVALLAENGLDQEWTLAAWREGFAVEPDGRITRIASNVALAASRRGLMRGRASDAWPAVAAARIPTLVLLATEPAEQRESNAEAGGRMREAIPHADVRPIEGMRHAVLADLGASTGALVADWLRAQRLAGVY